MKGCQQDEKLGLFEQEGGEVAKWCKKPSFYIVCSMLCQFPRNFAISQAPPHRSLHCLRSSFRSSDDCIISFYSFPHIPIIWSPSIITVITARSSILLFCLDTFYKYSRVKPGPAPLVTLPTRRFVRVQKPNEADAFATIKVHNPQEEILFELIFEHHLPFEASRQPITKRGYTIGNRLCCLISGSCSAWSKQNISATVTLTQYRGLATW